jgi:hypothetical protein
VNFQDLLRDVSQMAVRMVTTVLQVVIYSHDLHRKEVTGCGGERIRLHMKAISHTEKSRISRYYMMSYLLAVYLTVVSISQTICIASNRKLITNNDLGNTEGAQKFIHNLIEVIYGHNHKVEPKCNVWCIV